MRKLTIAFSMLLTAPGDARAESLATIRNALAGSFHLVVAQPALGDKGLQATLKKIEGNKITFVRAGGRPDDKEETLIAADDCRLLEARFNYETKSIDLIPVEGGLKGDIDAKEFVSAEIFTGRDGKIVEIRGNGVWRSRDFHRYQATFKKIEDDKIEVYPIRGSETKLSVRPDCKVFEARFAGEGLPLVTSPVADGLKAEVFTKERVRALIVTDAMSKVWEVCILRPHPHVFDGSVRKIEGSNLILTKRHSGREVTLTAAAHCEVVEYQSDKGLAKAVKVPFEPGPPSEFLTMKRVDLRFHTNKEHKITSISVLDNPNLQKAIVKIERPDMVRVFKEKKGTDKREFSLAMADHCRILQARVDRETAATTFELVKGGIKGAPLPTRMCRALFMQNEANKIIEFRIVKDPTNFPALVSKVEMNDAGAWTLSVMEPAIKAPGSEAGGTYHSSFMVSKDCRVFKRRSAGGKSVLEPVEGNNLLTLRPKDTAAKGETRFLVARILLGGDGKVAEVQILDGVKSVEP